MLSILIDPDKISPGECVELAGLATESGVDYLFIGSSILAHNELENCLRALKESSKIPVIIFPGDSMQISNQGDAILFLSLISGRNPELLIGKHVLAAPLLRKSKLEIISTGYMLIDSGTPTSASYMSHTQPIPHDKNDIAVCTAMAGEMLGLKMIFMDAGSGARHPVSALMIASVRKSIAVPLIVGGGIRTPEKAIENCNAGADMIVIGNAVEQQRGLVKEMAEAIHSLQLG